MFARLLYSEIKPKEALLPKTIDRESTFEKRLGYLAGIDYHKNYKLQNINQLFIFIKKF